MTAIDFAEEAIERVRSLDAGIDAQVMDILKMDFPVPSARAFLLVLKES